MEVLIAKVDTGDTAWMLAATALVLMMTPALGLFYAGLVRSKNTLNTFMMCIAAIAIAMVTWAAVGYSFAFSEGNEIIGGFDYAFLQGRQLRAARGSDDPAPGLLRLPGDVLHHHHGAGLRRRGRADAVRALPGLRGAVVGARLLGARPLGVRARLAAQPRHARLRRRRPGRDGLRVLRPRRGAGRRRPQGLRSPGAAAPQRRLRPARRRAAVVRLVRVQRRQRLQHRQQLGARVHEHPADAGLHAARLVRARRDPRPAGHRDRRRDGDHRRLRRDHAGGRLRQPRLRDAARRSGGASLLLRDRLAAADPGRRDARRARRPRGRRVHRHPLHRLLRAGVVERGLRRLRCSATPTSSSTRSLAALGAPAYAFGGDLRAAEGDRRGDAAARRRARGGAGNGRHRTTARRPTRRGEGAILVRPEAGVEEPVPVADPG